LTEAPGLLLASKSHLTLNLPTPSTPLTLFQVFFAECALADAKDSIRGKRCLVSGSGCAAGLARLVGEAWRQLAMQ